MSAFTDISGLTFGRALVLRLSEVRSGRSRFWCRCDCGKEFVAMAQSLKSGHTRSCGCLYRESRVQKGKNLTHGMSHTREHDSWGHMRKRCENPRDEAWPDYGGRGITVCERWQKFENFYADMGACPDGFEIERDNYEPGNCRWASRKEQTNNTRRNRMVELGGELVTVAQLAEATGLKYSTAYWRHVVRGNAPSRGSLMEEQLQSLKRGRS
jgi:hypothetical protein